MVPVSVRRYTTAPTRGSRSTQLAPKSVLIAHDVCTVHSSAHALMKQTIRSCHMLSNSQFTRMVNSLFLRINYLRHVHRVLNACKDYCVLWLEQVAPRVELGPHSVRRSGISAQSESCTHTTYNILKNYAPFKYLKRILMWRAFEIAHLMSWWYKSAQRSLNSLHMHCRSRNLLIVKHWHLVFYRITIDKITTITIAFSLDNFPIF